MAKKKEEKQEVEQPMRAQLLQLVDNMLAENFDFTEKKPIFTWRYEERPDIVFTMQISSPPKEGEEKKEESKIITPDKKIIT